MRAAAASQPAIWASLGITLIAQELPATRADVAAEFRAHDPGKTVTAYFRKTASGLELVGLDRTW